MKEIIVFFLNGKKYGVEISGMQSLESYQDARPLPDAPEGILGTVEIRKEIFPVLDIHAKLGAGASVERKKILLFRTGAGIIACVVDGVGKVFRAEGDDVQSFPKIATSEDTDFVDFVVRMGQELIVVVKPDALLTKKQAEWLRNIDFSEIKEKQDDEEQDTEKQDTEKQDREEQEEEEEE